MKMKRIVYMICVLVLIFIFTACGKNITGEYVMVEMQENGNTYDKETLELLGMDFNLKIDNDTATLTILERNTIYNYDDENLTARDNSEIVPYKVDGDKIILNKDNKVFVFQKNSKE